jgi:hypothetical protein
LIILFELELLAAKQLMLMKFTFYMVWSCFYTRNIVEKSGSESKVVCNERVTILFSVFLRTEQMPKVTEA